MWTSSAAALPTIRSPRNCCASYLQRDGHDVTVVDRDEQENGALGSALVREIREAAGVRTEVLTGGAIRELEPALGPQYRSALFFPEHGHSVNPYRLVQVLSAQFCRAGGTLLQRRIDGFELGEHAPRRLLTDAGPMDVETLVVIARLNEETFRALDNTAVKNKMAAVGVDVETNTPEQFTVVIREETAKWARVIKTVGAKAQ